MRIWLCSKTWMGIFSCGIYGKIKILALCVSKTGQVFLQHIFRDVRNGTISMAYLSSVLPNGSNFSIPNLVKFDTSTLI